MKICSKDREFLGQLLFLMGLEGDVVKEGEVYCFEPYEQTPEVARRMNLIAEVTKCIPRELLRKAVLHLSWEGQLPETTEKELKKYAENCPAVKEFLRTALMGMNCTNPEYCLPVIFGPAKPLSCREYFRRLPREGPLAYAYEIAGEIINTPRGAFMKRAELISRLSEYVQALRWAGAIEDTDELAYRQFIACISKEF